MSAKKLTFVYKRDIPADTYILKPYCFKWIFLYRIKELYLFIFSYLFRPFLRVCREFSQLEPGEYITGEKLEEIHQRELCRIVVLK